MMTISSQTNVEMYGLKQGSMLAKRIHEMTLALDSELVIAMDIQYREQLVKAAYCLRKLEELIER